MLLAAPSPGRSPALPKAFGSVRRREAPTLRVLVHGARWRPHPRVGAGPHPHALHLPVPGVLGHSLLVHRVHGLRGEQSSLLCHPPRAASPRHPCGAGRGPWWRRWWPCGTHWGVLIQHPGHVLVTPLWGQHCGVLTPSTPHFLVTPLWGTHWGGLQFKHPTHVGHPPMGNPLWGLHPQHPTLFGHLPMGSPLWGSSA